MEQETAIFILNDLLIWVKLNSQVKRGGERCPVRDRVTQLIFNLNPERSLSHSFFCGLPVDVFEKGLNVVDPF